ncbi:PREDICTED: uncharacterized protein LOC105368363 [Ceratosolen solmsi marchali]|uniref:Uncharacterized protein LOC105368363 n=1 Tax=Ceratosolen solmsi marchali TaxID=326594 RepID=A0AAJ6YWK0_9HYME|nr:PREDICTED: uncharacterized protein LOC105368363 [Ceratosolen solmsi marchali]
MKEPWKKTCNGKVIITLNDEKTAPTEVEVPVDLNWTNRSDKKHSAPKAVILMGIVLILGLTVVTLFKVQNLVYSTSYINWRMQELESTVSDSNNDVKLIKFKMSLQERDKEIAEARASRAEPLIASIGGIKNIEHQFDNQDLKLAETQNHKLSSNSLISETTERKNSKEAEVQNSKKISDNVLTNVKSTMPETKNKVAESTDLDDARNHPNPSDPEEWIKPLVETFDIFGNQPIEDHFIQNVLMKLLMPENNFEVLEFNKMHEAGNNNNAGHDAPNQSIILNPMPRNVKEKPIKPLPMPIESLLMKSLIPPASNFKIFHFNEKPEQQPQNIMGEDLLPKTIIPNIKALIPSNNMKIFQLNDRPEQNPEDDPPKITIQSIKLKLLPLSPQDDFADKRSFPANENGNNNFEIIRLNESPEPSQDVEAPKMPLPPPYYNSFPIPIQDLLMKTILPSSSKGIEFVPLNDKPDEQHMIPASQNQQSHGGNAEIVHSDKFNPLPIPIQSILMNTLLPPPNQNADDRFNRENPEQTHQEMEVTKIPIRTININPFSLSLSDALMKSMLPINAFGEHLQQQQQQQQQQPPMHAQSQEQTPIHVQAEGETPIHVQPHLQPQNSEVPRGPSRSTKLNPVDETKQVSPSTEYPTESAEK